MWLAFTCSAEKTYSGTALDVPPPGAGLDTVILAQPSMARSAAGTVAAICVDEIKLVCTVVPLTCTVEPAVKLVPVSVIPVLDDPLTTPAGEMELTEGI